MSKKKLVPLLKQKNFIIEEVFQLLPLIKVYKIKNENEEEIGIVKQVFSVTSKALEIYTNKVKPILEFKIFDSQEKCLATFKRNWNIFLTDAEILNSKGKVIGLVQQNFHLLQFKLSIKNSKGEMQAEMKGSKRSKKITIQNINGKIEGRITPKWGGIVKELIVQKNSYSLALEPPVKNTNAVITYIAAVVLLDLMVQGK